MDNNIIEFPRREADHVIIEFEVGLGSVEEARHSLETLVATATAALYLIDRNTNDGETLAAVERLFEAYNTLLARERGIVPGCVLPRFPQRSEDRAREGREPDGAA
jgi:hypothetical protein